jgi:hypothetical protein
MLNNNLLLFGICGPCFVHNEIYSAFDSLYSTQTRIPCVLEHLHTENIHLVSWMLLHLLPLHIVAEYHLVEMRHIVAFQQGGIQQQYDAFPQGGIPQQYAEARDGGASKTPDGYFQYVNVPAHKEYEFGWNRGNQKHYISRYEQSKDHRFRTRVSCY